MTTFNPLNKEILTFSECLDPAMKIMDQSDANQYKLSYIDYTKRFLKNGVNESNLTAEQIVNANLGYWAGYYSNETRGRIEKLFNCSHPIFGAIKENGIPSPQEAIECGKHKQTLAQIRDDE